MCSRRIRSHARLDDLVRILHGLAALDLVDVLHPIRHLAPDRILAVEKRRIVEANEELAVGGIRARRAGHRSRAAHMWFPVELGLEFLTGAAGAGAVRAAGLRHEAVDHAVEHDAVVEALTNQLLDARDMARREVGPHLDGDGALRSLEDQGVFSGAHARLSWVGGEVFRLRNWIANGRPAAAPAIASVNGIGVQRCNASITAIRYCSRSSSEASADS